MENNYSMMMRNKILVYLRTITINNKIIVENNINHILLIFMILPTLAESKNVESKNVETKMSKNVE
jgi:hypothetical protein